MENKWIKELGDEFGPKKKEKKTETEVSDCFNQTEKDDGFDGEGTGQISLGSGRQI